MALSTGCLTRTGGAKTAPRCLNRKETLVASAQARASRSPNVIARAIFSNGRHARRLVFRLAGQNLKQIALTPSQTGAPMSNRRGTRRMT
jgi:hypothetical protein